MMKNYTTQKSTPANLAPLKKAYLKNLSSPKDGMWQTFTTMADHHAIKTEGEVIGYFAINPEQTLLEFFLHDGHDQQKIFNNILTEMKVSGAVTSTAEPAFQSLCLDHQKKITASAMMFHVNENSNIQKSEFADSMTFRLATTAQLETAVDFAHVTIGADRNWLSGYYTDRIKRGELYGLWQDGKLIAAGECRLSDTQKPYADVGMIVSQDHRGRGLATNILRALLIKCQKEKLKAICSTEIENIAAQKAIIHAGFTSHNRIIMVEF